MIKYIIALKNIFIKIKEYIMAKLYLGNKEVSSIYFGSTKIDLGDIAIVGYVLTITSGTTEITNNAFQNCPVVQVTIPASVTSLGWKALACSTLKKVYFAGNPPSMEESSGILAPFYGVTNATFYYKSGNTKWTSSIRTSTYGGSTGTTWSTY